MKGLSIDGVIGISNSEYNSITRIMQLTQSNDEYSDMEESIDIP